MNSKALSISKSTSSSSPYGKGPTISATNPKNDLSLNVVNGNNLEDLHSWMYNFRIISVSRRWTSEIKDTILTATTTGSAATVMSKAGSDASFEERWKLLQQWYFPHASIHLHLDALKSMKKSSTETWQDFNDRFLQALDKVNLCRYSGGQTELSSRESNDFYLDKLPLTVRKEMKSVNGKTLDEVMQMAVIALFQMNATSATSPRQATTAVKKQQTITQNAMTIITANPKMDSSLMKPKRTVAFSPQNQFTFQRKPSWTQKPACCSLYQSSVGKKC